MPFVSERWLGWALTNFRTVRDRMARTRVTRVDHEQRQNQSVLQENAVVPHPVSTARSTGT